MATANNRVTHVHFTYKGSQYQAAAQTVMLSAGGIGTPLLLRKLGIDQAGCDFFFDPLVVVAGTLGDLDGGRKFPMVAGFDDIQEGYLLSDLIWPGWVRTIFTLRAGRLDRLTGHRKKISIMAKIKDDLSGRLTGNGWADKRLTHADHIRLKRGVEVAKKILVQAGARNIYQTGVTAVHPGGTAKIGEVVDSDLKTKFDNLYVCDASVIPEAWGLPPAFTVLALSKRLSKHLAQV